MQYEHWQYLQTSLREIDHFIRQAFERVQEAGNDPTSTLRGLVITDEEVEQYLQQSPLATPWPEGTLTLPTLDFHNHDNPLSRLIQSFGLNILDSYILLLSLAPEFDLRYERIYAYLQDDVSQRRPTVNLMLNLLGGTVEQRFAVWKRLTPQSALRRHNLIECAPDTTRQNASFLGYAIRADHRITAHLLGDEQVDARLTHMVRIRPYEAGTAWPEVRRPIVEAMQDAPIVYLSGGVDLGQMETAMGLCAATGHDLVEVNLAAMSAPETPLEPLWRLALREAYLRNGALLLESWESCLNEARMPSPSMWEAIMAYPHPVFISGREAWEPVDLERKRRMLRLMFQAPDYTERFSAWEQFTQGHETALRDYDLHEVSSKFRLTRAQIARAVHSAVDMAQSRGEAVQKADLYAGAQAHANIQLGHLAKRIIPRFGWDDLILPPEQLQQLHEMSARLRYTHVVQDEWGFGEAIANSAGISALFAGESGTGKTLSAEVLANDLGLVLYKIDLSAVVSKYIGETEKNLNTIFSMAQSSNAILFFDEADALFGKRSEVKDARDRYANIEVAYLLQQVEAYDGVVIMATNFRQNLDDAFTRRLDFLVDFPFPEAEYRLRLWRAHFPPRTPLASDVDLETVAERYRLAGGNIRNAALAAAYLAAANGQMITSEHIRGAIRREHQKMGRLLDDRP